MLASNHGLNIQVILSSFPAAIQPRAKPSIQRPEHTQHHPHKRLTRFKKSN